MGAPTDPKSAALRPKDPAPTGAGKDDIDPKKEKVVLQTATVARGRTVVGLDGERVSAGGEVRLPPADILRLRELGFLVNPDAIGPRVANGPTFGTKAGPMIHRV